MNTVLRERTTAFVEAELERDVENDLLDLVSAEDFLNYFQIPFDASMVQVNRLHILQRFHNYLESQEAGKNPNYDAYRYWLAKAYEDFTKAGALDERVFAVLRRATGTAFVSADKIGRTA